MKFISVTEFIEKYGSADSSITSSTIYYLVQNKIVKSVRKKTKYGHRKVFDEERMLKECKYRHVISWPDDELLAVSLECREYEAQRLREKRAKRKGKGVAVKDIEPVVEQQPDEVVSENTTPVGLVEEKQPVEVDISLYEGESIEKVDDTTEQIEIHIPIDPQEFQNAQ